MKTKRILFTAIAFVLIIAANIFAEQSCKCDLNQVKQFDSNKVELV